MSGIRKFVRFAEEVNATGAEFIRQSTCSGELLKTMAVVESSVKYLCRVSLENTSRENVLAEVSLYNYTGTWSVPNPAGSPG